MKIKEMLVHLRDLGVRACTRNYGTSAEVRLKKEQMYRQLILKSGCIRRVK